MCVFEFVWHNTLVYVVLMRSAEELERGKEVSECRFYAPARSFAGQRRHIKPGKLHQGNKIAIKWHNSALIHQQSALKVL